MTSTDIKKCQDIEKLRKLALDEYYQLSYIAQCVEDESKEHYTKDETIHFIREYLTNCRNKLEL